MKTSLGVLILLFGALNLVSGLSIINGRNATDGEIPHQVILRNIHGKLVCGGSIINENWILTAAQCLHDVKIKSIVYNTLDQTKGDEILVSKQVINPTFNQSTIPYNDIGLIQTAKPMKLNQTNAKRVVLPKPGEDPESGSVVNVSGWGATAKTFSSRILQVVSVPVVGRIQCQKDYAKIGNVTEAMMCAGLEEQGGKDSCIGDGGGPATTENGVLVGLVSWGRGCAEPHYPGVYTRVAFFREWIASIAGI